METTVEINNYNGALQKPLHSGFNAASTTNEVIRGISLNGKIAIVTGGNTGIGLETTKTLAAAGATVIVAARDLEKARKNLAGIPNVELEAMDMMDTGSVDSFSKRFLMSERPLNILINNAGIMWVPLRRDKRGIESQLVTNFVAQFELVAKLWPALKAANGARVVNVSSQGHQFAPFDFDDPNFEHRSYETLHGYGQSKTATILFAVELDNRGKDQNIRAYSLHPGAIGGTELAREAPLELFQQLGYVDENGLLRSEVLARLKTIPQGAATTVWCATSPMLDNIGGVYCENVDVTFLNRGDVSLQQDHPSIPTGVRDYAVDEKSAKKLWKLAEKMTGIEFEVK
ncbi:SDR family NAD(P)-dependent oxidoreductase [Chryseolinea sp. T2]|uniref:SDR family NAD(P)-dependent oxidoreductase n=1 Tax=Chryseolinea sp. T2 TaxID=3129255 RepID=UPI0030774310